MIQNAPVICNHTHPHLRGRLGDSPATVQGNDFSIAPTVWGKCQGADIRIFTPSQMFCNVG